MVSTMLLAVLFSNIYILWFHQEDYLIYVGQGATTVLL